MAISMTGDIQKRGVLFMFGGSRVLKMVPEVVINMGGNKKLVIGSIHETQENGPTPTTSKFKHPHHKHVVRGHP